MVEVVVRHSESDLLLASDELKEELLDGILLQRDLLGSITDGVNGGIDSQALGGGIGLGEVLAHEDGGLSNHLALHLSALDALLRHDGVEGALGVVDGGVLLGEGGSGDEGLVGDGGL